MSNYLRKNALRPVPQSAPLDARQVKNHAGGYVYKTSDEDAVRRFIVLGTEGGTFYASEHKLTKDNTQLLQDFASANGARLTDIVVEISKDGRAPRQSPGLFALAIAASHGSAFDRSYALAHLNQVARTASTLFEFISYVTIFRGWGNALRNAVADWYNDRDSEALGYQVAKYRERHGFTHRDLLRLSHPKTSSGAHNALYKALVSKSAVDGIPESYERFLAASQATPDNFKGLVDGVSWEFFPTTLHKLPEFWTALMDAKAIPFGALVRNLPRFSALGIDDNPYIESTLNAGNKFAHPITLSVAAKMYGKGINRNFGWTPNRHIQYALDNAVMNSFGNITPSGKRIMVAVDVSGSMGWDSDYGSGSVSLTPREMAAIMSLGFAKTEKDVDFFAFSNSFSPLNITKNMSPATVISEMSKRSFGGTDCALPMVHAAKSNAKYDAFVVLTDNETWAGNIHPMQALKDYRKKSGISDAKLIVAAFSGTPFTIADPEDSNTLDIVGTDSAIPQLSADFIAGRI